MNADDLRGRYPSVVLERIAALPEKEQAKLLWRYARVAAQLAGIDLPSAFTSEQEQAMFEEMKRLNEESVPRIVDPMLTVTEAARWRNNCINV